MDRIYRYNPNVSFEPNGGRYLQVISAKDLYRIKDSKTGTITNSLYGNHN